MTVARDHLNSAIRVLVYCCNCSSCPRHLVSVQWFYSSILINQKCFPDEPNYQVAPSPPFDSISSIRYSPTNPHQLLVSAWDAVSPFFAVFSDKSLSYFLFLFQTVRLYEVDDGGSHKTEAKAKFDHRAAVLACSFSADGTHAFSGGLDTVVKEFCRSFFFTV